LIALDCEGFKVITDQEKSEFNARAKASMAVYLKSRTWPEKIRSIERMNAAARIARESMRKARGAERAENSTASER
jgi:hypothetical protein